MDGQHLHLKGKKIASDRWPETSLATIYGSLANYGVEAFLKRPCPEGIVTKCYPFCPEEANVVASNLHMFFGHMRIESFKTI